MRFFHPKYRLYDKCSNDIWIFNIWCIKTIGINERKLNNRATFDWIFSLGLIKIDYKSQFDVKKVRILSRLKDICLVVLLRNLVINGNDQFTIHIPGGSSYVWNWDCFWKWHKILSRKSRSCSFHSGYTHWYGVCHKWR